MTNTTQVLRILDIMRALRDPETGCPWDIEQTFTSIAPYTIEEAYEVADAIETGDMAKIKDELGDLLLQVVFHAQMADEAGHFNFFDVAAAISDKMERRHPHVFGTLKLLAPMRSNPIGKTLKRARGRKNQQNKPQKMVRPACSMMCPPPCPACHAPSNCNAALPASASTGARRRPFSQNSMRK